MRVLADAGPLVALLYARDTGHEWAVETLSRLKAPLTTCDAVIAEACFLLAKSNDGADKLLRLFERGVLISAHAGADHQAIRSLMHKYRDVPMSFADACLVQLCEQERSVVWTLDSDFHVYRRARKERIELVTV